MSIIDKFSLKGYTSIVTGGGNGLGKTMANALAEAGSNVAILDVDYDGAVKAAEEIKNSTGVETLGLKTNITVKAEVDESVQKVVEKFGKIDVLLNNSGIWRCEEAEKMSWENWYDVINVNLNGTFLMCQAVGKEMIKNRKGSIISIGTVSAEVINDPPYKASYNASKAGVIFLSKALAAEWARYNIRSNVIHPGCMKYEVHKDKDWLQPQKWLYPMDRWGYSEELCGALVYLASEASSFVTGQSITVDGGFTIWRGYKPFPKPQE